MTRVIRRAMPLLFLCLWSCARQDDPQRLLDHGSQMQKLEFIGIHNSSGHKATPAEVAVFLRDEDPWVVANACSQLGILRARQYIPELTALLASPEEDVANLAGTALAQMIDPRDAALLPSLYRNLEREELLVRLSAIEAIGKVRDPASVEILLQRLPAAEPAEKASLYGALGNIGDARALPALQQALTEVEAMDHSAPIGGHSRGQPFHPDILEVIVREAIHSLGGQNPP